MNNNNSKEEKLREDIKQIMAYITDLNKLVNESGSELEDTGEEVNKIKEDVVDIKKEIDETGENVEDIKEDIEEIKENIGSLKRTLIVGKDFVSKVGNLVLPDKFAFKDIAQQIVGATILSAPFTVTQEVWELARNMHFVNVLALILITLTFDILLYYYTKYRKFEGYKSFIQFPLRIISLIIVTYTTSFIMLTVLGVIGTQVVSLIWSIKLIVLVGLFANIGAGTADLIK